MQQTKSPELQSAALRRKYVRRLEMEAVTGIKARTWDDWDQRGIGPERIKAGKAVLYNLDEVIRFLESRTEANAAAPTPDTNPIPSKLTAKQQADAAGLALPPVEQATTHATHATKSQALTQDSGKSADPIRYKATRKQ